MEEVETWIWRQSFVYVHSSGNEVMFIKRISSTCSIQTEAKFAINDDSPSDRLFYLIFLQRFCSF